MKIKHIIPAVSLLALSSVALTSCDDDFDYPPTYVPEAPEAVVNGVNMTIGELKALYWNQGSGSTWSTTIGLNEHGDSIIIAGTIISSDKAGNIYKNMMVRGEGPDQEAVCFAIQKATGDSILSREHKFGQRIYINVTGMSIGMYSNYMEIGAPSSQYGITYMDRQEFDSHAFVDGMPSAVEPITATIAEINDAGKTTDGKMKWQSQLVKFEGVSFVEGGKATFGGDGSYGERYITDARGNRIMVRSSGMCDFAYTTLPTGTGTLVGILGFFNTSWQVQLIDISEQFLYGFDWNSEGPGSDEPIEQEGDGTAESPYTVADVQAGASGTSVWVTGYIVGWIDGMSIYDGANFSVPASVASNILIAASADETDYNNCVPVQLPSGSVRSAVNLQDNPGNLGKQVSLKGNLEKYFGVAGLKTVSAYAWGDKGDDSGSGDSGNDDSGNNGSDTPTDVATFTKATSIESGKTYIFVNDAGMVAIPIQQNYTYGYLYVEAPVSTADGNITTSAANGITVTSTASGYTLTDCYGRLLSMDDSHASFQLYNSPEAGSYWSGNVASDSRVTFTNKMRDGYMINWAANYSNFSVSTNDSYPLPYLYVKVD